MSSGSYRCIGFAIRIEFHAADNTIIRREDYAMERSIASVVSVGATVGVVGTFLVLGIGLGTGCFTSAELSCETNADCFSSQRCNQETNTCEPDPNASGGDDGGNGSGGDTSDVGICSPGQQTCGQVNDMGFGATCSDGECIENDCCNCRSDDGDELADLKVTKGGGAVVEEECQEKQGCEPRKSCAHCTFDPAAENKAADENAEPKGVCANQRRMSSGGECIEPDAFEEKERTLGDGKDNDCDGTTDEGSLGATCDDGTCEAGSCLGEIGACVHEIFVTRNTYSSDFGGLDAADRKCGDAGGDGNWKAILSTADMTEDTDEVPGGDRLQIETEVWRPDDVRVAKGVDDLWDKDIENPVKVDSSGATVQSAGTVWTGTTPDGAATLETCLDWRDTESDYGTAGNLRATDVTWVDEGRKVCDSKRHLYCINGQKSDEGE